MGDGKNMPKKIKPRQLNSTQVSKLYNITDDELTMDTIKKLLAYTKNKEPEFQPNDYFTLPAKKLYNDKEIHTTVGRYLFNRILLDNVLGPNLGYQNQVLNGGGISKMDSHIAELLLEDKISTTDVAKYLDKIAWMGYGFSRFLISSLNSEMLIPDQRITDAKLAKEKEIKEAAANGDIETVNRISKELENLAKGIVGDEASMEIYESGGRGKFGNNFKNVAIMRGLIPDYKNPGKFVVSTANLYEGIPSEEQDIYANIATSGSNSRAIATADGGYQAKKLSSAFQGVTVAERGSDCHSLGTIEITLNRPDMFIGRYMINPNGSLTLLNSENINDYKGKKIKLRSPMFCRNTQADGFCNKCVGEIPYQLGITNLGLASLNRVGNALVTLSLKQFHNSQVNVTKVNLDKYIV